MESKNFKIESKLAKNPDKKIVGIVIVRSNPIAPDPRVEKICMSLAKSGYRISVVGWDREDKFEEYEVSDCAKIYRIKLPASFGKGLGNMGHLVKWQVFLFMWLSKHRRLYDCIHACDFDTIIPALLCKCLYGKKVVYDIFDFYADMLRNVPGYLKRIIRRTDLFLIKFANAVIIADESRKKQIEGSSPKKLVVIYNSPSDESFTPRKPIERNSSLIVAYVGLLQKERGIIEMINVVKKHQNWKMVIGGFGGDENLIKECGRGTLNVEFIGRVPYRRTLEVYSSSDVLFATYDPKIPNHRFSSANKLFEAMMLGKPIIVAKNTGMDSIVEKYDLGFVVDYGNEQELESALKIIEGQDKRRRAEFASHVKEVYKRLFSWKTMERRLLKLYAELFEGRC